MMARVRPCCPARVMTAPFGIGSEVWPGLAKVRGGRRAAPGRREAGRHGRPARPPRRARTCGCAWSRSAVTCSPRSATSPPPTGVADEGGGRAGHPQARDVPGLARRGRPARAGAGDDRQDPPGPRGSPPAGPPPPPPCPVRGRPPSPAPTTLPKLPPSPIPCHAALTKPCGSYRPRKTTEGPHRVASRGRRPRSLSACRHPTSSASPGTAPA